jgi:uncharacterized protein YacL
MNYSVIMKASAIVSVLFGLALLLGPNELVAAYKGERMNAPGIYNSMLYGAALISLAVINWAASRRSLAEAKPVILGSLVGYVLGLIVALVRQLTVANVPPTAWLNVAIFAIFAALYAYLQLGQAKRTGSPTAGSAA